MILIYHTCIVIGELADQLNISRAKFVFATEDTIAKCQEAVEIVDACKVNVYRCIDYYGYRKTYITSQEITYPVGFQGVFPIQNMSSQLPHFNNCAMSDPLRFDATDDDLALVPFSSGTTGLPKGVELTHANLTAQLCQLRYEKVLYTIKSMLHPKGSNSS